MNLQAIQQQIPIPDLSEIKDSTANLISVNTGTIVTAQGGGFAVKIESVEHQSVALTLLRDLRVNIKAARAKFKTIKDPMNAAKDAVLAWEHEVLDPWEALDKQISAANSNFIQAQERAALEESSRIQREERERQQAEVAAEAKAREESGDIKGAVGILLEAEKAPAPVTKPVAVETAKVSGITSRASYSAEVVDLRLLVEYCLANPALLPMFIQANDSALNAQARQVKDAFSIPGVKLVKKYV